MEITRIKNVKDFPIVEQSEISEVLAYDAEGNLIRAKYDESEVDIDLSDYYNKSETDDIVDKLEKDIADASAALLGSQSNPYYETIRGAVAIGQAAQNAAETADAKADDNAEDIRQINEWADIAQTTIDAAWATAKDSNEKATAAETTANNAQTTANNAQNSAWAAQAAAETADAKADANADDIDVLETTVDYHSECIRQINTTIGDINNILSSL